MTKHIFVTGGVVSGLGKGFTAASVGRLLKQRGLKVASHAHGTAGIKNAIKAGVDTIEHASYLDKEAISKAKSRGVYLSMDIYNTERADGSHGRWWIRRPVGCCHRLNG